MTFNMGAGVELPRETAEASVCVVIPTYNGMPYLARAVESVREQSHRDWELIICDNCSTDGTTTWLKEEQERNPDERIRVVTYDTHLPMVPNWNRALGQASSKLIKILPADDVLLPDCLRIQVGQLKENSDLGFVTSSKEVIDAAGKVLFRKSPLREGKYTWATLSRPMLSTSSNPLGEPGGVLFRQELLDLCGGFDPRFRYYLDMDLLLRFLRRSDAYVSGAPLYQFRVHGSSTSAKSVRIAVEEYRDLLAKYEDDLHLDREPWLRGYLTTKATLLTLARALVFSASAMVQRKKAKRSPP